MDLFKKLFRKKVIVVIHGLENKPPKDLLEKWCRKSVREGLRNIGKTGIPFALKVAYWADLLHEMPQDPKETDKKTDTFLDDPYLPGDPGFYRDFVPNRMKKKLLDRLEKRLDRIYFDEKSFINFDRFANILVRRLFKDLDCYYHRNCPVPRYRGMLARDAIRMRLADVLRKYHGREILLIAHSMGTIISYDVLVQTAPDVTINRLITIGSPLAMPLVIKKILAEQGRDFRKDRKPATPENVIDGWDNFSDLDDTVAINYSLADDYRPNSRGIGPNDVVVYNNYEHNGKREPHKIYGYLRAPEVSRVIADFCVSGRYPAIMRLRYAVGKIFRF